LVPEITTLYSVFVTPNHIPNPQHKSGVTYVPYRAIDFKVCATCGLVLWEDLRSEYGNSVCLQISNCYSCSFKTFYLPSPEYCSH